MLRRGENTPPIYGTTDTEKEGRMMPSASVGFIHGKEGDYRSALECTRVRINPRVVPPSAVEDNHCDTYQYAVARGVSSDKTGPIGME